MESGIVNGLIIDAFAGGGGASTGIKLALGRSPDIAIDHDPEALAMHAANHPRTLHVPEDVWHANLRKLAGGRPVSLLWLSPDCKHFSRAKGGKPVSKNIRSLAWVAVKWARQVKPACIVLENVREFVDWGPVVPQWVCQCGWTGTERTRRRCPRCNSLKIESTLDLMPDPLRKGMTFRLFVNRLRGFGYAVQWRTLNAADFGAPTHRRRLFLIARCDGQPIVWPEPTHGDPKKLDNQPLFGRLKPWRTAAECIDWSIPCPSIFDRKRPLKPNTLRRVAMGIKRYVLDNPRPFIVRCAHGGDGRWGSGVEDIDQPLPTLAASKDFAVVSPVLVGVDEPLRFGLVTVTIDGEPYVIADIGMRMLTPRELARAQGFPESYVLTGTKTNQVARIGNSVAPAVAQAIVAANIGQAAAEVAGEGAVTQPAL